MQAVHNINPDETINIKRYGWLSKEELQYLLKLKKRKRNIDAHVLLGELELYMFIEAIIFDRKNNLIKTPHRIQFIHKMDDREHWSVFDILVTDDKISIFQLDAVNLSCYSDLAIQYKEHVTFTITAEDKLQQDTSSCSIFSIDHLFHLSKIPDLHDQLKKHAYPKASLFLNPHTNQFQMPAMLLPPILVKNAQSLKFIDDYLRKNQAAMTEIINNKKQSLLEYVNAHTIFSKQKDKHINGAVLYKEAQYRKKIFTDYIVSYTHDENISEDQLKQQLINVTKYTTILEGHGAYLEACDYDEIMRLVAAGVNPNIQSLHNGLLITALHGAAFTGNLELVKWLIEHGADASLASSEYSQLAIHYAATAKKNDVVKYFVAIGVDINARDEHGITAIGCAAASRNWDLVTWLIEHDAIIDRDTLGFSGSTMMQNDAPQEIAQLLVQPRSRP